VSEATLAYATTCRYCGAGVFVAVCSDGKWRSFGTDTVPAAPALVWAWRKHQGMQEQELVPGKLLHFCAGYSALAAALPDRPADLAGPVTPAP